jgi:cytochrome c553
MKNKISQNQSMIRTILAIALAAAALAANAQTPAPAGDPEKGAQKVAMCQGCHGIPGWRTAYPEVYRVPKIAGQHPSYLVKALQDYKSGARSHPSMRAIAASLSEADMTDIAAYYAQLGLQAAP